MYELTQAILIQTTMVERKNLKLAEQGVEEDLGGTEEGGNDQTIYETF